MADPFKFEVQRATPGDVERLGQMLDAVFRPQLSPGEGMPREFPHLFCAENANNIYYAADGGKPVSMVAVLPQQVTLQGVTVNVASIGSVATLPEYQGRKISSAILDQVIADWTAAGVPLMLVSGDRGLYRRIHCVPVGEMLEVTWGAPDADDTGPASVTTAPGSQHGNGDGPVPRGCGGGRRVVEVAAAERAAWASRLAPLYRAEAYRYRRTDEQMATLVNALWFARADYSQRLFAIFEGDAVVGYVTAYQALKWPETVDVMEWAGSRVAVLEAMEEIRAAFGAERIRFHVHATDVTMQSLVKAHGLENKRIALQGTVRLLDIPALFEALGPVLVERFGARAEVRQDGDTWEVQVGDYHTRTDSLEELTSFVFDEGEGKLGIEFAHTDDLNYI